MMMTPSPGAALVYGVMFSPSGLIMMGICVFFVTFRTQAWDFAEKISWWKVPVLIGLFALSIGTMFAQSFNPFLYFQF